MDNKNTNTDELPVRFPGTLSLKDLITLVSVAVSLTIAWGVFGTRISLIEKEMESHSALDAKSDAELAAQTARINRIERRQIDNEFMIDRLYEESKIPQPKRRAE